MIYKIIPVTQRKDGSLSIDTTNIKIKQGDYDSYQLAFESNHDIPDGTNIQVSFRRADGQQSGYLTLTKVSPTRSYLNMKNRWFTNVAGLLYMTFQEKEVTTQNVERILKEQSISLMIYAQSDFNPIEDIIPSDFDVYKLEVDGKFASKLDKDFSTFEKDTNIDGTELIPIYDKGTNKTINSSLLVNKVNTVNNVQPDSNKNITLKGNNIDTSLTYSSLQDKTLDELFEMFYLLSIRGVYHEDTDDDQLMSIRTGEYKNINPKTIAVNVSTTLSNVQDELNNIKDQIQYVYLFKGVYASEEELLKAYPNGVTYDDGIWCILTDTDTVWVYDNETLKWKNSGSAISGVLSVNDITPDNNGNIHLSGTDINSTVSDNGTTIDYNITTHLQRLYNYIYNLPNMDDQLDVNSSNPVKNYVIATHINTLSNTLGQTQQKVDTNTSNIESNTSTISSLSTSLTNHINNKSNPHSVTKSQIGLGNVDNTSDNQKPVSVAQANAINVVQSNLDEFITTTNTNFNRCLLKSGSTMNTNATLTAVASDGTDTYTSTFNGIAFNVSKTGGNSVQVRESGLKYITSNGTYNISLPEKSGTIVLTSDLSSYLPLSGGTMTGKIILPNDTGITSKDTNGNDKLVIKLNDYNNIQIGSDGNSTVIPFGNLKPADNKTKTYDLGTTSGMWRNIYGQTLYQNGVKIDDTYSSKPVLLWENPTPNTQMNVTNGTLTMPNTDFKYLKFEVKPYWYSEAHTTCLLTYKVYKNRDTYQLSKSRITSTEKFIVGRIVTISNGTNISIGDCSKTDNFSSISTDNSRFIITAIYGVK